MVLHLRRGLFPEPIRHTDRTMEHIQVSHAEALSGCDPHMECALWIHHLALDRMNAGPLPSRRARRSSDMLITICLAIFRHPRMDGSAGAMFACRLSM